MGLFDFLFRRPAVDRNAGRDGSSPEQAIVVGSVGEEYAWMRKHCAGFQLEMQTLDEIDAKSYDVITLRSNQGEEKTVYFDISSFFGK